KENPDGFLSHYLSFRDLSPGSILMRVGRFLISRSLTILSGSAIMGVIPRPCLKNVNMPKRRFFFRHTALIFLAIHKVLPRQIALSGEKIPRRWTHFQFSNKA